VLALALAMVLGVGSAGGRTLTITTLTVEVIGQGQVSSDPSGIKCGEGNDDCYVAFSGTGSVDLKASPAGKWSFETWGASYDTDTQCGTDNHCIVSLDGNNHVVTANFQGPSTGTSTLTVNYEGNGNVHSGEINCGTFPFEGPPPPLEISTTDCTWSALTGSTLTVHELPDTSTSPGWVFAGWAGSCKQVDDACTIKMDANRQITATWVQSTNITTLSVTVNGNGRVTGGGITCHGPGSCTENETQDSTVTLHADPDNGYMFTGWTGACVGASDTCNVTMDVARAVTATFTTGVNLNVTVNGNGNVSGGTGAINCGLGGTVCSATFAVNATVTLIATPATGATFTGWTGACGGTSTSCTVLMSQGRNVTATFTGGVAVGAGFLLSVTVSGSGTVTGAGISCGNGATICSTTPAVNSSVTLTATPAAGATFSGWGGSCFGTIPTCTVQMTAARSVTATFTGGVGGGATVRLTVTVTGSGTVSGGGITCGNGSGACNANLTTGSSVTLTATPATGATFTAWGGACTGSAPTCTVSMTSAKSVSATFTAVAPGTLAITVNGKGSVSAPLGKCIGTGVTKTCIQKYAKGRTVTLTVAAAAGNVFSGWDGACAAAAKKPTCTVTLDTAKSVSATFVPSTTGGGGVTRPVLTSLGPPIVRHTAAGFRVTLRFNTTRAGIARVLGLRAGRVGVRVTFRIAAGPARIGPFTVAKPGLYTFQVRLGTALLQWRVCLGRCGAAAPPPPFILVRKPPTVTRSGDVWSVTLHVHSNQIAVARVRAVKDGKVLVDQRFLAKTGEISIGPFLLGPGSYTLRLNATDAYGRTRNLSWVVALAA
jgi:uncharacterized repeat protein (TIGR02543 family)